MIFLIWILKKIDQDKFPAVLIFFDLSTKRSYLKIQKIFLSQVEFSKNNASLYFPQMFTTIAPIIIFDITGSEKLSDLYLEYYLIFKSGLAFLIVSRFYHPVRHRSLLQINLMANVFWKHWKQKYRWSKSIVFCI